MKAQLFADQCENKTKGDWVLNIRNIIIFDGLNKTFDIKFNLKVLSLSVIIHTRQEIQCFAYAQFLGKRQITFSK